MLVLAVMIEPSWAYRGVGFARREDIAVFHAIVQGVVVEATAVWHTAPVGLADETSFSAYPSQVATYAASIGPDADVGL